VPGTAAGCLHDLGRERAGADLLHDPLTLADVNELTLFGRWGEGQAAHRGILGVAAHGYRTEDYPGGGSARAGPR
jgi:hypothetical protein